ncbi:MAG: hypothetical protein EKK40_02940 [Bradyrhizobiaceae bacterium]|nr:MAG: hypothetical protein EKK40_02940 [Bradyrhizobiaceae bacterium]
MQITCPHCTTSYTVDPAKFGPAGRTVRCARCQETWLARPQQMAFAAAARDHAGDTGQDVEGAAWQRDPPADWQDDQHVNAAHGTLHETPHIESPSISADWGVSDEDRTGGMASNDGWADEPVPVKGVKWFSALGRLTYIFGKTPAIPKIVNLSGRAQLPRRLTDKITLSRACMAMGAVVLALIVCRSEVVRFMPQTATFFKMAGLGVNLRGLTFEDVKITSETVNGKPVLVIEGAIASATAKPVELPRLRFSVRDEQGSDIYSWNSVLEQPVLNPGEKVWFKSRLASPPAEGREIAVRFFQRRDVVAGGA